jgi:hypothetical protein
MARIIQKKKEKSFWRKIDFLAKGKKSYYTEKSHFEKVILTFLDKMTLFGQNDF